MRYIGLDAGSVSVKLVVFDEGGRRLSSFYQRHKGQPLGVALELLNKVTHQQSALDDSRFTVHDSQNEHFSLSLTGSAGRLIGSVLGIEPVNEVVAYAYATSRL